MRFQGSIPVLLALFVLAACDDPSNVGSSLVDAQAGAPSIITVDASSFETEEFTDITGNTLSSANVSLPARVLVGSVDDPLLGTVDAEGYFDYSFATLRTNNFETGTVTSAYLNFFIDYVYGDTTATITATLYDISEEVETIGGRADTSYTIGAEVTTFSFLASDDEVRVDLPASWIEDKDAALRSDLFSVDFHGFKAEATSSSGNAVVGLTPLSEMWAVAGGDTTVYRFNKSLTNVDVQGTPGTPPDRILFQDGVGRSVALNFELTDPALQNNPLHRAAVQVFADTLALLDAPVHFVRPPADVLQLIGVDENGVQFILGDATRDNTGRYVFIGNSIQRTLQDMLLGEQPYSHFRISVSAIRNTINPALFLTSITPDASPSVVLTITPLN